MKIYTSCWKFCWVRERVIQQVSWNLITRRWNYELKQLTKCIVPADVTVIFVDIQFLGLQMERKMVKMVSCSGKHKRFAHSHNWESMETILQTKKKTYELFTSFRLNILQMEEAWTFWLLCSRTQTPNNLFQLELFSLSLLATLKIDLNSAASDAEQLDTFVSFVFALFYA